MIFFISSILIQAYCLEPLISPIYAQVKPVKMDTASSKPTQKSMSLAEGPKTPEGTHTLSGGNDLDVSVALLEATVLTTADISDCVQLLLLLLILSYHYLLIK